MFNIDNIITNVSKKFVLKNSAIHSLEKDDFHWSRNCSMV